MKKVEYYRENDLWSDAVIVDDTIYLSGMVSEDYETEELILGTIEKETTQLLKNIEAKLIKYGSDLEHIIKVEIYLRDYKFYDRMNNAYNEYFANKERLPIRLCFGNVDIYDECKIEMCVTAFRK